MTTHIKLFTGLLLAAIVVMSGCDKDDYQFGDITTPTKPVLSVSVAGKDAANPDGDGTGNVAISIQSDNAINYKVDFGDNTAAVTSTSSAFTHQYKNTTPQTFTISVSVFGKAGSNSTSSADISTYVAYQPDPALVTMLTNNGTKKWRVDKSTPGHLGVSDAAVYTPAWWAAAANEKDGLGIYDDVYTFTATGNVFSHETNNDIFGSKEYLVDFDPSLTGTGDFTLTGPKAAAYTSTFGYEGSTTEEFITFTGKGHLGMYKGVHKYQVLERTDTEMTLRCLQDPGAWYVKIIAIQ